LLLDQLPHVPGNPISPRHWLLGPNGKPTASLQTDLLGATYIQFFDESRSPRLTLGLSENGKPGILLFDSKHNVRLSLRVDAANGNPSLLLEGQGGLGASVAIGAYADGASVALSQNKGGRLYLHVEDQGSAAGLCANDDKHGIALMAFEDDQHISLTGGNRVRRVSWWMLPDGSPELHLLDETGKLMSVMTLDHKGKTTFRKPPP
jgi:hypothetical protein